VASLELNMLLEFEFNEIRLEKYIFYAMCI